MLTGLRGFGLEIGRRTAPEPGRLGVFLWGPDAPKASGSWDELRGTGNSHQGHVSTGPLGFGAQVFLNGGEVGVAIQECGMEAVEL